MKTRIKIPFLALTAWITILASFSIGARDYPTDQQTRIEELAKSRKAPTEVFVDEEGYTHWRSTINSGCSFSDHNYSLDVQGEPLEMSSISYSMSNYDVDYNDPQGCPGGPEVDRMYLNGHELGILKGANNSWSINTFPLTNAQVVKGNNSVFIDTDSNNTGCWCVGVGYIEVVAKVGFQVISHTPTNQEKNRDFHSLAVNLTAEFSNEYDPATLTDSTFLLEYLDKTGSWQQTSGLLIQLGPKEFEFIPNADLLDGVNYRATIKGGDTGVKSLQGGKLEKDFQWSFWTVPDLDISNTFGGKVCVPEPGPCPGLEVAVFQVARNAPLVEGKSAVARVFARWKKHDDVAADSQVKDFMADIKVSGGGSSGESRVTVMRPDQIPEASKKRDPAGFNFFHTPSSTADYQAILTPTPQSNNPPIEYTSSKVTPGGTGRKPAIDFDYYFLKDGGWAAGVPAAGKTDGRNLMTVGSLLINDQFPSISTGYTEKPDLSIGYTYTGSKVNVTNCGAVREVSCPLPPGVIGPPPPKAEIFCVYEKLATMLGGKKFVAATVPDNQFCVGATAFAIAKKVFMHQFGGGGNDGTVAHEVGHIYGISTANNPTAGHRNNSRGVEGYQVRIIKNRSFTRDPDNAISLMHTTVQPQGTQWVHNADYTTLIGTVGAAAPVSSKQPSGAYLILTGEVDFDQQTAVLGPAFLQDLPNDGSQPGADCQARLLDGNSSVLSSVDFQPGIEISVQESDGATSNAGKGPTLASGPQFFSASLPWHDAATQLQVACKGVTYATRARSLVTPQVQFTNVNEGATLSGVFDVKWAGTDSDSPSLAYQLQYSTDGGNTWTALTPLIGATEFALDTSTLPTSANAVLRIMASDGFNTSHASVHVTVQNGMTAQGMDPPPDMINVNVNTPVTVYFSSPLNAATLTASSFKVTASGQSVAGKLSYDPLSRKASFVPDGKLKFSTQYQVELTSVLSDEQGNTLTPVTWLFTTAADDDAPTVKEVHPGNGETDIPVNSLIQVDYSEAVNPNTVTAQSFTVRDQNGADVAGQLNMLASNEGTIFIPAQNLESNSHYTVVLTKDITDMAGLPLQKAFNSSFVTGSATMTTNKLVGNYLDQAKDDDADGFFDRLVISVGVQVTQAGSYNLNGRLLTNDRGLIQWSTTGDIFLNVGFHMLALEFKSSPIRNSGVNGPYILDALNFYPSSNPNLGDVAYDAFHTYPYDVAKFFSIMTLGPLPNQFLKVDTVKYNAINLPALTKHQTDPVDTIKYSLLINALPQAGVSIDSENNIDINPQAGTESESDVTVQAVDQNTNRVQSTFHVGVQKPAPGSLVLDYAPTMNVNTGQIVTVDIFDQFGDKYLALTTVNFSATLGSFSAASVDTNTGRATVVFNAGAVAGDAFITVKAGKAEKIEKIRIVKKATFTVTPSAGVGGSVNPNTPQQVAAGGTLTLTVVANNGYSLDTAVG